MALVRLTDSMKLPAVGTEIGIYQKDGSVKNAVFRDGKVVEAAFGGLHDDTYIVYGDNPAERDTKLRNITAKDFLDVTWEPNEN